MVTLENAKSVVRVVPERGANVVSWDVFLRNESMQMLYPRSAEELISNPSVTGIPVLAPYCGRLGSKESGKFPYKGKMHTEPYGRHGFLRHESWDISSIDNETVLLTCTLDRRQFEEEFPYCLNFEYTITVNSWELLLALRVKNTANYTQPISVGWHPYFRTNPTSLLFVNANKILELERPELIPKGDIVPLSEHLLFSPKRKIAETEVWDDVLIVSPVDSGLLCTLQHDTHKIDMYDDGGTYQFLQIYTPPYQGAICLEPLSDAPNAFNLVIENRFRELERGATAEWKMRFVVTPLA